MLRVCISAMSNDQGIPVGRPHGGLGIPWKKYLGDYICIVKYEQDSCIIMGPKFAYNAQMLLILNIYMPFDDGCHGDNYECFWSHLGYYTLLSKIMTPLVHSLLVIGTQILLIKSYLAMNWYLSVQNMITLYQTLSYWVIVLKILHSLVILIPPHLG